MNRFSASSIFLAVVSIAATACDRAPADITGPASGLTLSYGIGPDVKRFAFDENFDAKDKKPSKFEATGFAPVFANNAVNFPGLGTDRGYLRTIDGDYDTVGFEAEVTVTVTSQGHYGCCGVDGSSLVWFGLGAGAPGGYYNEPIGGNGVIATLLPTEFFGPRFDLGTTDDSYLATALGQAGDGTHRLRMTWNHNTHEVTVEIQSNYKGKGAFKPTATLGPIAVSSDYLTGNAHIFFGGAGHAVFDDFSVKVMPKL